MPLAARFGSFTGCWSAFLSSPYLQAWNERVNKLIDMHPHSKSRRRIRQLVLIFGYTAVFLAPVSPAKNQTSNETIRVEREYRECLYSKTKNGRYARGERESDFALLGECRNQWVAYMDVCTKSGFDNESCVLKSRLLIHAILNLTGK
jgi:hypothetical protein